MSDLDRDMPDVPESDLPASAREQIGRALDGALTPDQIKFLISEVLAITKKPWGTFSCKSCGKVQKQQCEVPDAKAVTGALKDLMDQSWGRPSEVRQEGAQLIVNRSVTVVAAEEPVSV